MSLNLLPNPLNTAYIYPGTIHPGANNPGTIYPVGQTGCRTCKLFSSHTAPFISEMVICNVYVWFPHSRALHFMNFKNVFPNRLPAVYDGSKLIGIWTQQNNLKTVTHEGVRDVKLFMSRFLGAVYGGAFLGRNIWFMVHTHQLSNQVGSRSYTGRLQFSLVRWESQIERKQ